MKKILMGFLECKNPKCYLNPDPKYCDIEKNRLGASALEIRRCASSLHIRRVQKTEPPVETKPRLPRRDNTRTTAAKERSIQQREWRRNKHQD